MSRIRMIAASLALCGCWSHETTTAAPEAKPAKSRAPAVDTAHGRSLVEAQVHAAQLADPAAFLATFDPSAIILWPTAHPLAEVSGSLDAYFLQLDPHEQLAEVLIEHVAVTGNAEVLVAEFGLRSRKQHFEGASDPADATIEISEVFTRASGWKVVALAGAPFGEPASRGPTQPIPSATSPGPVTALLLDPKHAIEALRADAIVVGPTERATGSAGRDLLARLPPMTLRDPPREVVAGSWGIAVANIDLPGGAKDSVRAIAQLVALRDETRWTIACVHVLAL